MKKLIYLPLLLLTLVVGVNKVNADTVYFSNYYNNYDFLASIDTTIIDNLISYYNTNLANTYSNYIISYDDYLNRINLTALSCTEVFNYGTQTYFSMNCPGGAGDGKTYYYRFDYDDYSLYEYASISPGIYYSSKEPLTFVGKNDCIATLSSNCNDNVQLPSYSNLSLDVSYPLTTINVGDIIPTYMSLTNGEPSADFTQVDMSQYEYIILSLKNYNTEPFNTSIYSLGRLCFTPVYDYGMTQKQSMYAGYQTAGCTEYYNSSTPVMIFIIQADIDNHAVYYIKRYNDETNILNIPTSIFDITYITSANASDPQVEIGGRSYPALPYSDLTDTANKSSEEGYISGRVCSLGDVNCQASATGMDISDLFTQPLKLLQSLWTSITSVFTIITTFITILPPILQTFLYVSFMLGIVIGIIKILL